MGIRAAVDVLGRDAGDELAAGGPGIQRKGSEGMLAAVVLAGRAGVAERGVCICAAVGELEHGAGSEGILAAVTWPAAMRWPTSPPRSSLGRGG